MATSSSRPTPGSRTSSPSYRDRAIRIAQDEHGYEVLLIDGQPLKTLRGQLGALGGIEMDTSRLLTRGQITYAEGSPPGALRSRRAAARDGRRGHRRGAALSHHRHLLGGTRHRRRPGHRLHAGLQPLAGRVLPDRSQAALPGRPHLAARSRGRRARRRSARGATAAWASSSRPTWPPAAAGTSTTRSSRDSGRRRRSSRCRSPFTWSCAIASGSGSGSAAIPPMRCSASRSWPST